MRILKVIILFISICLITISCDSGNSVYFRKVYYPLDELLEAPKVYCYKEFRNGRYIQKGYTINCCHVKGQDTILSMSNVNKDFILRDKWDMEVNENGVRMVAHTMYNSTEDGIDSMKSTILKDQVHIWEKNNNRKNTYHCRNKIWDITRTAYDYKIADSINFRGKNYLTYSFKNKTLDQYSIHGSVKKLKMFRTVYYSEGIGMVKTVMLHKGVKLEYKLKKILNYADWLKLKEESLSDN